MAIQTLTGESTLEEITQVHRDLETLANSISVTPADVPTVQAFLDDIYEILRAEKTIELDVRKNTLISDLESRVGNLGAIVNLVDSINLEYARGLVVTPEIQALVDSMTVNKNLIDFDGVIKSYVDRKDEYQTNPDVITSYDNGFSTDLAGSIAGPVLETQLVQVFLKPVSGSDPVSAGLKVLSVIIKESGNGGSVPEVSLDNGVSWNTHQIITFDSGGIKTFLFNVFSVLGAEFKYRVTIPASTNLEAVAVAWR